MTASPCMLRHARDCEVQAPDAALFAFTQGRWNLAARARACGPQLFRRD